MVEKIVVDAYNHLWILTNRRLTEYDPRTQVYRVIGTHSPLSLPRFMPRALTLDADSGDVLVGGFGGMLLCRPSLQLEGMARPVRVRVTDLRVAGNSMPLSSVLPADARDVEIHFSTLDHLHASTQRYAYRIDDGGWDTLRIGVNTIHLPSLTRGDHELQLRATDANGLWSDCVTSYHFSRKPQWYETPLAFFLYALTAVLLLYLLIRYLMHRSRREEEQIWYDSAELVAMHDYVSAPSQSPALPAHAAIDQMLLDRARDIVLQHLGDIDFGVNDLATGMNMSRSTLVRKLKSITGQTPLQFVRQVKMEQAQKMLGQHTATVADVARRLGYSDREHFANVFRQVTGQLPSQVLHAEE